MFSKQLKSVKFVTSKSFETHFYSFLDFSHLKSIFCEVPESILTITGNTWQFKTSLFWEQAFIFASWFDPIFDFNQSIYFGGNTLTIMFNQFQLFSFFLDHWFLLGSWCSLAHREPKWLRNLFPGANFVDCYLGLFCGHIDGKEYSEYTAMRSSSGKVRIWKNWPTTGRDGDRAKHTF